MNRVAALALALMLLAPAAPTAAQMSLPGAGGGPMVRFGFGGGVSVPTSDAGDVLRNGINGQAYLLVNLGVPLRFNIGYQRFEFDDSALNAPDGQSSILSGIGGVSLPLVRLGPLQSYVTAGLGAFKVDHDLESGAGIGDTSQMRFGIDAGGGLSLRIGRLDAFIEGRVQNVYTDSGVIDTKTIRAIPVTFGILF